MRRPRRRPPRPTPATAAAHAPPTVAVSYFDNNTGKTEYDPLAKGLADMLITDLGQVGGLRVVEREKLNQVLAELKLSRSKFIDPKTAQRVGKGLAARFILSGGYTLVGDTLRIDARVFNVETGAVLTSERVEGKRDEFFALEKDIADALIAALEVKLASGEKSKLRANATQSFEAWSSYAAGLDAQDRGDAAAARAAYAKALAADPNYRAARNATERLAVIFAQSAKQTETRFDASFRDLDPKAKDFAQRVSALLQSLDNTRTAELARKLALLSWLGRKNLLACTVVAGPASGNPTVIVGGMPSGGRRQLLPAGAGDAAGRQSAGRRSDPVGGHPQGVRALHLAAARRQVRPVVLRDAHEEHRAEEEGGRRGRRQGARRRRRLRAQGHRRLGLAPRAHREPPRHARSAADLFEQGPLNRRPTTRLEPASERQAQCVGARSRLNGRQQEHRRSARGGHRRFRGGMRTGVDASPPGGHPGAQGRGKEDPDAERGALRVAVRQPDPDVVDAKHSESRSHHREDVARVIDILDLIARHADLSARRRPHIKVPFTDSDDLSVDGPAIPLASRDRCVRAAPRQDEGHHRDADPPAGDHSAAMEPSTSTLATSLGRFLPSTK